MNLHDNARRVIVIGNLTIDDVVLPDGQTRMASVGGNSVYSALAARMWSAEVGLVTRRGADFDNAHLRRLASLGVDTGGVVDIEGPTVRNWVLYGDDGSRTWVYRTPPERSGQVAVQPEDLPDRWLTAAGPPPVVHVAAMPLPAAQAVVKRIRERCPAATITLDTHEDWVVGHQQDLLDLARAVDVFVPSREELTGLVGYDDPRRAAGELLAGKVPSVVVKLGADGAIVASDDGIRAVAACPVRAVDTTGAGDAFCGGLAAGLAVGDTVPEAVWRGCVSASFAVTSSGSMALASVSPHTAEERRAATSPAGPPATKAVTTTSPAGTPDPSATEAVATAEPTAPRDERYGIGVMMDEIAMIPTVLDDHLRDSRGAVQAISDLLVRNGIENLFITGCGDSAFAGSVTALAFVKHAGVRAEGVHALDLARYRVRYLPPRSAVIGVSFSGKVGRTTEALVQARKFGHLTIALSNAPQGAVARASQHLLPIEVPTLGFSPGTSTYLGMVATLTDLAVRWGQLRGRDTTQARTVLGTVPKLARETLLANDEPCRAAAELLRGRPWVSFLGAGPNEATGRFGAAKLFEGPQIMGVATNIEEWAHEEYFITRPATPVIVVAPSGAAYSRAEEILSEINFIGARPIVISDRAPGYPAHLLPLAGELPEEFSPLLCALPLSLLGFHLAEVLGKRSYNFSSEEIRVEHYDTIHRATIGEPA
ncbi:MAG TPA: PfkB family carbohydrate kinase [Trebonia sp.]|nr:PfkB family carbohydrate kinase [Trebonia sp.]